MLLIRAAAVLAGLSVCLSSTLSIASPGSDAGGRLESPRICAISDSPSHSTNASFIWQQPALQATVANHSGKLVVFDGHELRVFNPNAYSSPDIIPLKYGIIALALSDKGTIAWLETDLMADNSHWQLYIYRKDIHPGPVLAPQRWRVPQTWPELYFVGERLYISEQRGKLSEALIDSDGRTTLTVEVPPSDSADLSAPLAGGGFFQYRWNVSSRRGSSAKSSVELFRDLNALRNGRGFHTPIVNALVGWQSVGDRVLFLAGNPLAERKSPWVYLIHKTDGKEMAQLDYDVGCEVDAIDLETDGAKAAILLHSEAIQIVDIDRLRVRDQFSLPQSTEYSAVQSITSVGLGKFLIRTGWGVALVDSRK